MKYFTNKGSNVLVTLLIFFYIILFSSCKINQSYTQVSQVPVGSNGILNVYFIDVGKGDATLIGTSNNKWILVDSGPKKEYAEVVRLLKLNSVDKLEAIFVSHPHSDHIGGLEDILPHVGSNKIYTTPVEYEKDSQKLNEIARVNGIEVIKLNTEETINIDNIIITVLGPNGTFSDENDNSLVFMLDWDGSSILFAGDQLFEAEESLLKKEMSIDCDILKAGHHGEVDASSLEFIKMTCPEFCIITNDFEGEANLRDISVQRFQSTGSEAIILSETGTMLFQLENGVINRKSLMYNQNDTKKLIIDEINIKIEYIRIKNDLDEDVSMTGWSVYSEKGNETYFFPDNAIIKKGQCITVYSGKEYQPKPDDLFWKAKSIWHDTKEDTAILFDQYGREIDRK